jgi:hypothetical protein
MNLGTSSWQRELVRILVIEGDDALGRPRQIAYDEGRYHFLRSCQSEQSRGDQIDADLATRNDPRRLA